VTASGVVTAYLASLGTGTATLTGLPAQALLPPAVMPRLCPFNS
jgi:hypothetical protein